MKAWLIVIIIFILLQIGIYWLFSGSAQIRETDTGSCIVQKKFFTFNDYDYMCWDFKITPNN